VLWCVVCHYYIYYYALLQGYFCHANLSTIIKGLVLYHVITPYHPIPPHFVPNDAQHIASAYSYLIRRIIRFISYPYSLLWPLTRLTNTSSYIWFSSPASLLLRGRPHEELEGRSLLASRLQSTFLRNDYDLSSAQ
jgi:hypothetical protein